MANEKKNESYSDLRKEAERRVGPPDPEPNVSPDELKKTVHDLQVHQVELELQNEELRRIQMEVARSRQDYFELFHHAPVGYVVINEAGIIQETNRTFCKLTGREHDRLIEHAFADCIAPPDRPLFLSRFKAVFKHPEEKQIACRLSGPAGEVPVIVTAEMRSLPNQKTPALMLTVTDVTTLRAEEAARRAKESELREFFDHMQSGVAIYEPVDGGEDFVLIDMNRFGLDQAKVVLDEVVGRRISETFSNLEQMGLSDVFRRVLKTGEPESGFVGKYEDEKRCLWTDNSVFMLPNGRIAAVGKIINERKKAEREIWAQRARYRELARHLETVREEERRHLSRELHDDIGQIFTALKIDLVLLQEKREVDDEFKTRVGDMQKLLSEGIQSVHGLCRRLRPGALDDLGLEDALQGLIEDWQHRNDAECCFSADWPDDDLSDPVNTFVFRFVQEALTNVSRYAQASRVDVKLDCRDGQLCCSVTDDGVGMEEDAESKATSFGLLGMRERVEELNGTLTIQGEKGKGTRLEACIPL